MVAVEKLGRSKRGGLDLESQISQKAWSPPVVENREKYEWDECAMCLKTEH